MLLRRVVALAVSAGAALSLMIAAGPARAANGLEASARLVRSSQKVSGTYKVVFACEAHGTVLLAATGIEACDLYRRTPTGWKKLASAEPRKGVPGQAAATVGSYNLPVTHLTPLRVCWKANGLTRNGSKFIWNTGCTAGPAPVV